MPLQFQGYGDPFARQKMDDQKRQDDYGMMMNSLQMVGQSINNNKRLAMQQALQQQEQARQNELMKMKRTEFQNSQDEYTRQNTVTPVSNSPEIDSFSNFSVTQKNPNPSSFPGLGAQNQNPFQNPQMGMQQPQMGAMPQNSLSLFQGGAQQPQMSSDLVAAHKAQFPHLANLSMQSDGGSQQPGMPPEGYSPKTYQEKLKNDFMISETNKNNKSSTGLTSELPKPTFGWKYNPDGTISSVKGGPGEISTTDKIRDDETKAKTMFLSQSKDFADSATSYQRIIDSSKNPTPAGDLSLIYNYMKMLDPGSTVREGEFATAQNSGSLPQSLVGQYNKVINGERFDPSLRTDFVNRATQLYAGQKKRHDMRISEFRQNAVNSGLNPDNVIINVATPVGGFGNTQEEQSQLIWKGRPIKDTPANRAWLQKQQGGQQ